MTAMPRFSLTYGALEFTMAAKMAGLPREFVPKFAIFPLQRVLKGHAVLYRAFYVHRGTTNTIVLTMRVLSREIRIHVLKTDTTRV